MIWRIFSQDAAGQTACRGLLGLQGPAVQDQQDPWEPLERPASLASQVGTSWGLTQIQILVNTR